LRRDGNKVRISPAGVLKYVNKVVYCSVIEQLSTYCCVLRLIASSGGIIPAAEADFSFIRTPPAVKYPLGKRKRYVLNILFKPMNSSEKEITILSHIHSNPHNVNQRDLARIVGLSLGMTNEIVKRLATKGLLTVKRINNRNIHYIVTPRGIEAITRKSYRYFKRTIKNVVYYKESIENLAARVREKGFDAILLKGVSDLDFIVEYACRKQGLAFLKEDNPPENVFVLYSESYIPDKEVEDENSAFLQDLLI